MWNVHCINQILGKYYFTKNKKINNFICIHPALVVWQKTTSKNRAFPLFHIRTEWAVVSP